MADFGVFVNIGAPNWGLLHRSQFKVRLPSLLGSSDRATQPLEHDLPLQPVCSGPAHSRAAECSKGGGGVPVLQQWLLSTTGSIGQRVIHTRRCCAVPSAHQLAEICHTSPCPALHQPPCRLRNRATKLQACLIACHLPAWPLSQARPALKPASPVQNLPDQNAGGKAPFALGDTIQVRLLDSDKKDDRGRAKIALTQLQPGEKGAPQGQRISSGPARAKRDVSPLPGGSW